MPSSWQRLPAKQFPGGGEGYFYLGALESDYSLSCVCGGGDGWGGFCKCEPLLPVYQCWFIILTPCCSFQWYQNELKSRGTTRDWEPDIMGLGPTQGPGSGTLAETVGTVNRARVCVCVCGGGYCPPPPRSFATPDSWSVQSPKPDHYI